MFKSSDRLIQNTLYSASARKGMLFLYCLSVSNFTDIWDCSVHNIAPQMYFETGKSALILRHKLHRLSQKLLDYISVSMLTAKTNKQTSDKVVSFTMIYWVVKKKMKIPSAIMILSYLKKISFHRPCTKYKQQQTNKKSVSIEKTSQRD